MKRFIPAVLTALWLSLSALYCEATTVSEISIELTPGTLESRLDSQSLEGIERLRIYGSADVRDFRTLASLLPSSVVSIDMAGLDIEPYIYWSPQPDGVSSYAARSLPAWSLFSLPLEEVILPESLLEIGEGALAATSVRTLTLPVKLKSIGEYALYGCRELESVNFPNSLESLGKGALSDCKALRDIDLSGTMLNSVSAECFADDSSLSSVMLPGSLRTIGALAFRNTAVKKLNASMVTEFSDYALAAMPRLEEISLSPSARFGKGLLLSDASLEGVKGAPVVLPALFAAGCNSVDAAALVLEAEEIGSWALYGGKAESLTFNALQHLGEGALADFSGLKEIDVRALGAELPSAEEISIMGLEPSGIDLIVTTESETVWRTHPVWGTFNIIPAHLHGGSVGEIAGANSGIEITLQGRTLHASCPDGLETITLHSIDGTLLYSACIDSPEYEINLADALSSSQLPLSDNIIIALLRSPSELKALKLKL